MSYFKTSFEKNLSSKDDAKHSLFTPSPQVYAAHALRTLGFSYKTVGYWQHGAMLIIGLFDLWFYPGTMKFLYKIHGAKEKSM